MKKNKNNLFKFWQENRKHDTYLISTSITSVQEVLQNNSTFQKMKSQKSKKKYEAARVLTLTIKNIIVFL